MHFKTGPANTTSTYNISSFTPSDVSSDNDTDETDKTDGFFGRDFRSKYPMAMHAQTTTDHEGRYVPTIAPSTAHLQRGSQQFQTQNYRDVDFQSDFRIKIRQQNYKETLQGVYEPREVWGKENAVADDSKFMPPKQYVTDSTFEANDVLMGEYISSLGGDYRPCYDEDLTNKEDIGTDCGNILIPMVLSAQETGNSDGRKHAVLVSMKNNESPTIIESKDYRKNKEKCQKIRQSVHRKLVLHFKIPNMPTEFVIPKSSNRGYCASYVWLYAMMQTLFNGLLPGPVSELDDFGINLLMAATLYNIYRDKERVNVI